MASGTHSTGPLTGVKVVEIAGQGPAPFAAMLLGDLGADVVRVDRWIPAGGDLPPAERRIRGTDATRYVMHRSRRSIAVDLKAREGAALVLDLVERADVLIEGFRPGVAERLGLGPDECLARNPRLVYGRMTGWGQDGPLSRVAGHDINYVALSGALSAFARAGQAPVPPVNFLGDMGGGGLMLAFGIVSALLEARSSGTGQVIDAAIVDGAATLSSMLYGLLAQGRWQDVPGTNFVDTGSHYYDVYRTADDRFVAVGAIEPPFYAELLRRLELDPAGFEQGDVSRWPDMTAEFARVFASRTRDEWTEVFAGSDACVTPVLSLSEAHLDPHNRARKTFTVVDDVVQPAPAPRFSRTPAALARRPPVPGEHTEEVLRDWGLSPDLAGRLRAADVIGVGSPAQGISG